MLVTLVVYVLEVVRLWWTGLLVESFEPFAYNEFQSGLELVGGEGGAFLQQAQSVPGCVSVQEKRPQLVASVRCNVSATQREAR